MCDVARHPLVGRSPAQHPAACEAVRGVQKRGAADEVTLGRAFEGRRLLDV
ncbi:hypothetical protein ACIBI4_18725 [Streptomyces sp. NPDC050418]|uniref:hypothetical protein n=1 Tax=Streptomyces sp. NPDC050418 TaxID=3365612 RepID=UPI0037A93F32